MATSRVKAFYCAIYSSYLTIHISNIHFFEKRKCNSSSTKTLNVLNGKPIARNSQEDNKKAN